MLNFRGFVRPRAHPQGLNVVNSRALTVVNLHALERVATLAYALRMQVLIIEDDAETAAQLRQSLADSGHRAEHAADGPGGLERARAGRYDALIVDRMLPGLDGLSLVQRLRESGNQVPVLFLTALGQVDDRVTGLSGGGDDYLAKPFAFAELLARLEAIVRRHGAAENQTVLRVGDLELD